MKIPRELFWLQVPDPEYYLLVLTDWGLVNFLSDYAPPVLSDMILTLAD